MVELKLAAEGDFPELIALTNKAYRERGPQASWNVEDMIGGERLTDEVLREDLAASPEAQLLVWRGADGEHLGHVWLEPQEAGVWYLGLLTVRPDRQDRKLGRALLAAAEAYARERGARRVRMTVVDRRHSLIAWYERRGYRPTGERRPWPYHDPRVGRPTTPDLGFLVLEREV